MKDLRELASEYDEAFFRYRKYFWRLKPNLLVFFLALLLFLISLSIQVANPNGLDLMRPPWNLETFTVVSELFMLGSWLRLMFLRDKLVVEDLVEELGGTATTVHDAKRSWLKGKLRIKPTEYSVLAKNLSDSLKLRDQHNSSISLSAKDVGELVFAPESKARLTSYVIYMLSIIGLVSVGAYTDRAAAAEELFALFENASDFVIAVVLISTFLWAAWLMAVFGWVALRGTVQRFSAWLDGPSSDSPVRSSRIIEALIEFNEMPRRSDVDSRRFRRSR